MLLAVGVRENVVRAADAAVRVMQLESSRKD